MEETHIMNDIKEACCFVSEDFAADLETCRCVTINTALAASPRVRVPNTLSPLPRSLVSGPRLLSLRGLLPQLNPAPPYSARPTANPIVQEYIFPDYSARRPGRIRNPGESLDESTQQTLRMSNERFSVPEILFRPTNIGKYHFHAVYCVRTLAHPDFHLCPRAYHTGLDQAGLSATVAASIALLPEDLQGMFWANIGLIGGNTAMPGFRDRLYVSPIAPSLPMGH